MCRWSSQQTTHLDLADLAAHRHRERVDLAHVPGNLVVRELVAAELGDLLLGDRPGRIAQHDAGEDLLSETFVGNPDDLDVGDLRVRVEELLYLARVDV